MEIKDPISLDKEIIDFLDIESLRFVKQEADNHLDEIESSGNIVSSKASSYFQIFIALLITLLGYIISNIQDRPESNILLKSAVLMSLTLSISLYMLFKVIFPKTIHLKGIPPYLMAKKSVINDISIAEKQMLINRIHNINIDIKENKHVQDNRSNNLKTASKIFMIGTFISVIYAVLFSFSPQSLKLFLCSFLNFH